MLVLLTPLDDALMHQAPTTFDHAVTSDHRFFDRWAVGVQHPSLSVVYGLANYKNTDVCDGFLCVQRGDRQHNLRLTRPLRPDFTACIGPLSIEILEPLWSHRLKVAPSDQSPLSCDLVWSGGMPAREEHPHHLRRGGRTIQDYCRFDQLGTATGWVAMNGERVELDAAFAWRDHSWGVRPGMGGADPVSPQPSTSTGEPHQGLGSLFVWLAFRAGNVAGQFQTREGPGGTREAIDGHIIPDVHHPGTSLTVTDIRHHVTFAEDHTAFTRTALLVTTSDGREWTFDAVPLRPAWAFSGCGYSGGWNDGLGLGVPRGRLVESDSYQLTSPADVVMPDGEVTRPWHRETDVRLTVNGVPGDGHLTVIARPPVPPPTLTGQWP